MADEMQQNNQAQEEARKQEAGAAEHVGDYSVDAIPEGLLEAFAIKPEWVDEIQEGQAQSFLFTNIIVGVKTGYVLRKVGDAYMVMPTGPRMREYRGMITLNETGAFLFKEAQKPDTSRAALIRAAMEEYKVSELEAAENVDSFIQQCGECNLFEHRDRTVTLYRGDPNQPAEAAPEADGTK